MEAIKPLERRCSGCVPWLVGGLPFSLVGLIVGSISAAGSRGQFAFELLEEFFTRLGDGFGPEVSFPVIMERGLWGESHGGAGRIRERRSVVVRLPSN